MEECNRQNRVVGVRGFKRNSTGYRRNASRVPVSIADIDCPLIQVVNSEEWRVLFRRNLSCVRSRAPPHLAPSRPASPLLVTFSLLCPIPSAHVLSRYTFPLLNLSTSSSSPAGSSNRDTQFSRLHARRGNRGGTEFPVAQEAARQTLPLNARRAKTRGSPPPPPPPFSSLRPWSPSSVPMLGATREADLHARPAGCERDRGGNGERERGKERGEG